MLAGTALAAVSFSAQTKVGPIDTWNYGNSLEGTSTKLVSVFATDCVPPSSTCSTFASDTGPYQGVYAMRSNITSPPAWSAPKRLSQATLHSERPTLASDGNTVYAGWVTQTSYDKYDPAAARVFYVRTSTDEGATWGPTVRVSPATGRVDYPILAAAEGHVYAIYTDANTGNIRLATSVNNGSTWTTKTVGKTTSDAGDGEGFYGFPTIGASGTNVAIGWFADNNGMKVGKVSNNSGAHDHEPERRHALHGSGRSRRRSLEPCGADLRDVDRRRRPHVQRHVAQRSDERLRVADDARHEDV